MNSRGSMGKILNEVENVRIVSVQQTDGVETSGFQRMEKVGFHLLVNVVSANGAAGRGQGAGHLAIIATVTVGVDLVDAAAVGDGLVGG